MASDMTKLKAQLDEAEHEARRLVADLTDERGVWRPQDHSWSVAQCLDHLARTNRIYLQAMQKGSSSAREKGRFQLRLAVPNFLGRWLAGTMEPPVKAHFKMKASPSVEPSHTASLADAFEGFRVSQEHVRAFLVGANHLELASMRFTNPFIPGIRFTLATGLHLIAAHERRHLWQAWRVRGAAEGVQV